MLVVGRALISSLEYNFLMQTIKDHLKIFGNFNLIKDPESLMDHCVTSASFALSGNGGLNSKTRSGRIIMIFNLRNKGGKVVLAIDNTDIKRWKVNKGTKGHKPKKKLILKFAE